MFSKRTTMAFPVIALMIALGIGILMGGRFNALAQSARAPGIPERHETSTPSEPLYSVPAAAISLSTGVFINERELTPDQVQQMVNIYRLPPPKGHFWYDSRSGLYGIWGRETAGYIRPGHNFGRLPAQASAGNTRVFINGRELNYVEVAYLQILFNGQVRPGRVWLDGTTWNIGIEGDVRPIANLALTIQQQQQRQRSAGSPWSWRDGTGSAMASDGSCTMMAVPGAPVYGTSGCN